MKVPFISAGHDNRAPGVVATDTKGTVWREAYLAMKLRDAVSAALKQRGVAHGTDGQPGQNDPLRDAVRASQRFSGPRVEFHFNAPGATSTGIEVLARPEHKAQAQSLAAAIHCVLGTPLRGEKGWKPEDSGHHRSLAWVSQAHGMVCEVAFLSNPGEIDLVVSRFDALVKSLADWFQRESGALTLDANGMAIGGFVTPTARPVATVTPKVKVEVGGPMPAQGTVEAQKLTTPPEKIAERFAEKERSQLESARIPGMLQRPSPEPPTHVEVAGVQVTVPEPLRTGWARIERKRLARKAPMTRWQKITTRVAAIASAVGIAIYNFAHWLAEHRLEIAVWLTLAGVVVLIVMGMRKEREA